jgi:hypothetical protein
MAMGAAALSPVEVRASSSLIEPLHHSDLLTGLLIALGCALFSAVLRRLPNS